MTHYPQLTGGYVICSNAIGYKNVRLGDNGAGGETRTPNRPITNRVLYQLSHASTYRVFYQSFCWGQQFATANLKLFGRLQSFDYLV